MQRQASAAQAVCPVPSPAMTEALLAWYDRSRRRLPWREDPAAYHVWISEIMLQQTRVEAVKAYYARFLERFPDIRSLAEADEDTCLKLWEGLGYYSRARNLQKAARVILEEYGGRMPATSAELRKLPGIGPYTSAAIASIAFGERIPAVDGNLLRIFARLALYEGEIKKPAAAAAAAAYFLQAMPGDRPGDFNQALMDLGAGICIPASPLCTGRKPSENDPPAAEEDRSGSRKPVPCPEKSAPVSGVGDRVTQACPLQPFCGAYREKRCGQLPVMPEKKARRIERRTILVIRDDDRVLIRRRPGRGLLAGLYEFPGREGWLTREEAVGAVRALGYEPVRIRPLPEARHIFTHKEWHMIGYEVRTGSFTESQDPRDPLPSAGTCFLATIRDLQDKYALPSALAAYVPHERQPGDG